jgi:uncharacterized membrane protein YbhN (UPF0104 family)
MERSRIPRMECSMGFEMNISFVKKIKWIVVKYILAICLLFYIIFTLESVNFNDVFFNLINFKSEAALLLLILLFNLCIVCFRFWLFLRYFKCSINIIDAFKGCIAGNLAGLIFIPVIGQVLGRQIALKKFNIPPIMQVTIAVYEKLVITLISISVTFISAVYIFGYTIAAELFNKFKLFEISFSLIIALIISLFFWNNQKIFFFWLKSKFDWKNFLKISQLVIVSIFGYLITILAFLFLIKVLDQNINIFEALAASAIISFFSSIPITPNGWGIRELASIAVLAKLGLDPSEALTISILYGALSMLTILIAAFLISKIKNTDKLVINYSNYFNNHNISTNINIIIFLGISISAFILYQFHIDFRGIKLAINFADPLALIALLVMCGNFILLRQKIVWEIKEFNNFLLIFSALLLIAFVNGWFNVGITYWSLTGRLIGWIVLMGYLSAGYLLVFYGGEFWRDKLIQTLAFLAIFIILFQFFARLLIGIGFNIDLNISENFQGYSGNRNAFVFQLLVIISLIFGLGSSGKVFYSKDIDKYKIAFVLGVLILGVILTGSRAGYITVITLLLFVLVWKSHWQRIIIYSIIVALLFWLFKISLISITNNFIEINSTSIQSNISGESSDSKRIEVIILALKMWWESPIFGIGLGTFFARSSEYIGSAYVIHSTPLWLLTEFGLFGVLVIIWSLRNFIVGILSDMFSTEVSKNIAIKLLIISFCVFGFFHEIFYQRIFWFGLGILLTKTNQHKSLY